MNDKILFAFPGNEVLGTELSQMLGIDIGAATIRHFPDGESYVNVVSPVVGKQVILICTLDRPDEKLLPLYFFCRTAKELGAASVTIVSPYLAYMRQDKRFHYGEAITSELFAALVSSFADRLITVDPHLHRKKSLGEVFSIPTKVLHTAPLISGWIKQNVPNPLLVGPDEESEQWVSHAAANASAEYIVLRKNRLGDEDVEITVPDVTRWTDHTPVLLDDIISTGKTMIATAKVLIAAGYRSPVCIGVHGVFAGNSYGDLISAGIRTIVTTNSIPHFSNKISIADILAKAIAEV